MRPARQPSSSRPSRPMTRSATWKAFLSRLTETLGYPAVVVNPKPTVVWRDRDALNHLELRPWTAPDRQQPARVPAVSRIAVNVMWFRPSNALLRRLGFRPDAWPGYMDGLRLEWTVLDEELRGFAEWLPTWVRGRIDPKVTIPLPPYPSHVWGIGLRSTSYAWTASAWDAYSRYKNMNARLTPGSISAEELRPALPR